MSRPKEDQETLSSTEDCDPERVDLQKLLAAIFQQKFIRQDAEDEKIREKKEKDQDKKREKKENTIDGKDTSENCDHEVNDSKSVEKEEGEVVSDNDNMDDLDLDGKKKSKEKSKKKKKSKHNSHDAKESGDDGKAKKKKKKKKSQRSEDSPSTRDNDDDRGKKRDHHSSRGYSESNYDRRTRRESRRKSISPDHRSGLGYNYPRHRHSGSPHGSGHRRKSSYSPEEYRKRRRRSVSRAQSVYERIDKQKLLEIARTNLAKMLEEGELPKGTDLSKLSVEHLPKSISQWTEYCRAISAKDARANSPDSLSDPDLGSDSDEDTKSVVSVIIRHPFEVKERKDIQIKVRDFVQIQSRSAKEVQKDLLEQFPVSSGTQHRTDDSEWKLVELMPPPSTIPEKSKENKSKKKQEQKGLEAKQDSMPEPSISTQGSGEIPNTIKPRIDLGTIMSQRLNAMRKLQEDPLNVVALKQMYEAEQMMQEWTKSKIVPGQFTGSTGASTLSPEELEGPRPAWTRKDQFSNANKIKDGIGMHLLMKMGWQPGQGLGKKCDGVTDPILPSLKFDTRGLVAEEEKVKKVPAQVVDVANCPDQKNPISFLQEYCTKQGWLVPQYDIIQEDGPSHKKSFIMKVVVNGIEHRPSVSCGTKKQAKALAATVCLQAFGLLLPEAD